MLPYAEGKEESIKSEPEYYEYAKSVSWVDQILLNRPSKVIVILLVLSVVAPLILYKFFITNILNAIPSDGYSTGSCLVPDTSRLLCGKGDVSQDNCHSQCCYDLTNNICFHRLPSRFSYITEQAWTDNVTLTPRVAATPYNNQASAPQIKLSIDEVSTTHLSLTFYNPQNTTIENGNKIENKSYTYIVDNPEVNIEVIADQGVIFDTNRGPLIATDNIWEITFRLTNENMYGFGEIPMTSTPKILYNHQGGLNSLPLIYARFNGSYHGLLIDVVEPTELYINGELLIVRSLTSKLIKFHIFVGPTPKDIMQDVINMFGKTAEHDYWMLGAHVCNYYSGEMEDIDEAYTNLTTFLSSASLAALPFESHCGTTPIFFNTNCDDRDAEIQYIAMGETALNNYGVRYVPHLSPYVIDVASLSSLCQPTDLYEAVSLQTSDGEIYYGYIGADDVFYPDYSNMTTTDFTKLWIYNSTFSGVILVNTWPLDEKLKYGINSDVDLPYYNKYFAAAFNTTPQWDANFPGSTELYFKRHNNYGNEFAATVSQLNDVPIWTTSPRMDINTIVNRQNIDTSWSNLKQELIEAALGGISGNWLWSSPICGDTDSFNSTLHSSLCLSWYHIGTFLPMIKLDSYMTDRHPLAFEGTTQTYMINALSTRLSLLPYFNTVLQTGPLIRPMFFEFPDTEELEELSTQFSVGQDLLIVPNLLPSQSSVNVWMPPGSWYEMWSGLPLEVNEGSVVSMATTEADILTLIRGGSIIAYQPTVSPTAEETRKNSYFTLIIALECVNLTTLDPQVCEAAGTLFLSENLSVTFTSDDTTLTISNTGSDFSVLCTNDTAVWANTISEVNIYGLDGDYYNYDYKRNVQTNIDLCQLETGGISLVFLE